MAGVSSSFPVTCGTHTHYLIWERIITILRCRAEFLTSAPAVAAREEGAGAVAGAVGVEVGPPQKKALAG